MTPEQFNIFLERNDKSTKEAVEKHVNGYMREMNQKLSTHIITHDAFMTDVKPILEAYKGGKVLGDLVKWLAAVGIAFLALKGIFMK